MKTLNIASTQNDLVKYIVKLQEAKFRQNEKLILLDGNKTIQGIIEKNIEFEYIFIKDESNLPKKILAKNLVITNDAILKKISTTKTPTNIVGIIKEPEINKEIFFKLNKIALIENIKDPGNLGTIIRSAAAFSFDGIILFGSCVDLYNSKVIRATAQNIFTLPIIKTTDINFIKELKKTHKLISTVVDTKNDFTKYAFKNNYILAFGSEASGLSKELCDLSDKKLTFFMDNNVESLNLAICASIAFAYTKFHN